MKAETKGVNVNRLPSKQKGASLIVTLIILIALGFAAYVGIQYVPQVIESKSIDSILKTMKDTQKTDRISGTADAKTKLVKLLQINEMNDMMDSFTVNDRDGKVTIVFKYDRELNLIYKVHPMNYEKTLVLR
jgi:flagellar basal body-associated protein FliL